MSKINAIRFINLNYNNNSIRISDEVFRLNGESTLLSLRNGGGKSVLVQMVTAPFVHKRYRDAKDRPFESYFTTSKPTFILVEWVLDKGAGYVLTGMMVRRSQDVSENDGNPLEMIHIISEYRQPCLTDINHIPVVEKGKKEINLKSFGECRRMFEEYKKDSGLKFFCYDMLNQAQSRQYFDKLMEYQIHYKEWENIIKKVNLKESGLSELFADCRDEKGLVEKWFLDAVENKLNKDKNRITEFQTIIGKYVGLYKDNQSKIKRRDTIRLFKEDGLMIKEKAENCIQADDERRAGENKIANFIGKLKELRAETQSEHEAVQSEIEDIKRDIAHVEYEKLSSEIYGLRDNMNYHVSNQEMIGIERDELERQVQEIEHFLYLMECAKQQKAVEEEKKELDTIRQQLAISRQKDADLEPERKSLGYMLKCYYEDELEKNGKCMEENKDSLDKALAQEKEDRQKVSGLDENINKLASKAGGLKENVRLFDEREDTFNHQYQESFVRNLFGEYEPGMLDIKKELFDKELKDSLRYRTDLVKQKEAVKGKIKQLERCKEELHKDDTRLAADKENRESIRKGYDEELEKRRVILKYLGLEETDLFDEEKIIKVSESKLKEIYLYRRNLEKEEDDLQKELQRLTEGKTLELAPDLEEELKDMGIHITYGMEWLQKNGYPEEKNLETVRHNPFLPYSLILSKKEIDRLSENAGNIYTSFPIPIVDREQLDREAVGRNEGIIRMEGINFYVLFNENLLNETKLLELVAEKKQQLQRKKEAISVRDQEYNEYFERQEVIKNQKVNKENYDSNEELLKELAYKLEETQNKLQSVSVSLSENEELGAKLDNDMMEADRQIEYQKRRSSDFLKFCDAYNEYNKNKLELEKCNKDVSRLVQQKKLVNSHLDKLGDEIRSLESKKDELIRTKEKLTGNLGQYMDYSEPEENDIPFSSIEEMTARFTAITLNMSGEIGALVEQENRVVKRYQDSLEELEHLRTKYGLEQDAWKDISYNRKEETNQECILEDKRRKIEIKDRLWNEEDKNIAVINNSIETCLKQMLKECGQENPLPKSEIQDRDFDAVRNTLQYQKGELVKSAGELQEYMNTYDENLTAMAEYDEFAIKQKVEWEEDFTKPDAEKLRRAKGLLVRDYRACVEKQRDARERLTGILNRVARKEEFSEDYYRKPLESMLELTDDGSQVLKQLSTTIQSYEELMEKLEVDISMVEKEKEKIIELLEDYIKEVHNNLGKIDSNSTITIRGRSLKMLKLELPEWDINESLYHIRLQDMIDEITGKGIEIFERNENAQEYFGTQITTRNVYDTIIGIGNVRIKLYKIEEQREYPITWAEVARNSGGEGFLSAFVILSSLLYYMRKDDTDLFADRNEGKVLLMDNPFAQTNASHLLKPLMDMAKKTNTQLICLTGLGGESIYNRFDNIYVINLIAASLRTGMQYLKVNHVKGNEPETMVVSQIEVTEQQELKLF